LLDRLRKLKDKAQPASDVATSLIGFLNGATLLLEASSDEFDEQLSRHLGVVYMRIAQMTRHWGFTTCQSIDKAVAPLAVAFIQSLRSFPVELAHNAMIAMVQHPNRRAFRYMLSIGFVINPSDELTMRCMYQKPYSVHMSVAILIQPIKLITQMATNEQATVDEVNIIKKRLKLIALGATATSEHFLHVSQVATKLAEDAQGSDQLEKWLDEHVLVYIGDYLNAQVTSEHLMAQLVHLQTVLTPILPSSLSNVNYQNKCHDQFVLVLDKLKVKDAKHRIVAVSALNRWYKRNLEYLAKEHPDKLVESLNQLVYLCQDAGDTTTRVDALKTLTQVIMTYDHMHPIVKDKIEGDSSYSETLDSTSAVDLSRLIADPNPKVRKEFGSLLRVCNHQPTIRWRYICSPQRVLAALSTEQNTEVKDILQGLLRYRFFPAKSPDDKDQIMASVKGLLKVHDEYGLTTLTALIRTLVTMPNDDYNVFAAVLRKFGHQIMNSFNGDDDENVEIPSNILISIKVGSLLWQSLCVTNFDHELDIVSDTNRIWVEIINKVWKCATVDDETKVTVLRIACKFPSDTVDQLFTKISAAFKRPQRKPQLLVQTLVQWEKTGDLWSLITDWFTQLINKVKEKKGPHKIKRIRFANTDEEEQLTITDILRYLNCLCEYEQSFKSAASQYALEALIEFESVFMGHVVNDDESAELLKGIKPSQMRTLGVVKQDLMSQRNEIKHENMTCYFEAMKSFDEIRDSELQKRLQTLFKNKLIQVGQMTNEGSHVIDSHLEEQFIVLVETCADPLAAIVLDIVEFVTHVLKYRIYQDVDTESFILKIITLTRSILALISKAERNGKLEMAEKPLDQLIIRLINAKTAKPVLNVLFDTSANSIDVSRDAFEDNGTTSIVSIAHLVDFAKSVNLAMLLDTFAAWIDSRQSQSEAELEKEEYIAAWLVSELSKSDSVVWGDEQGDLIKRSKLMELGRDGATRQGNGGANKSNIFDESGFDNEHSIVSSLSTK